MTRDELLEQLTYMRELDIQEIMELVDDYTAARRAESYRAGWRARQAEVELLLSNIGP